MDPRHEYALRETRRYFFGRCTAGLGAAALGSVLNPRLFGAGETDLAHRGDTFGVMPRLNRPATAKRVIWLFMADAPSQLDLFDYKPAMVEYFDKDLPDSVRMGQRITTMTSGQARFPVAPSLFKFAQHGKLQHHRVSGARSRPQCHLAPLPWHRPRTAHVPIPGPRFGLTDVEGRVIGNIVA